MRLLAQSTLVMSTVLLSVLAAGDPPDVPVSTPHAQGPDTRRQPGDMELTPPFIEVCLEVADEIDARLAARLRTLREQDPERFVRRLGRSHRLLELARIRQEDLHLYSLKKLELDNDAEVSRLAGAVRAARDEGRPVEDLVERLRNPVRLQLAFSLRAREDYVCRLREVVGELEEELMDERRDIEVRFDSMVEERIRELIDATSEAAPPRPSRDWLDAAGPATEGDRRGRPWGQRLQRPGDGTTLELTADLIDAALAVATDIDAELASRLWALRDREPDRFERQLRRSRRLLALAELRLRDPSLYDLKKLELHTDAEVRSRSGELRAAIREGRTADVPALEEQLRLQVRLQLAFSLHSREDHLQRLREEVRRKEQELAAEHTRFESSFDEMVEQRIRELVDVPSPPGRPRVRPSTRD